MRLAGITTLSMLIVCALARAGSEGVSRTTAGQDPFSRGAKEFEVLGGALFSLDSGPSKPPINYALGSVRFGIMLTTPGQSGFFAGNSEFLFEGFGAGIFSGPGTALGGVNILLRRNFVRRPGAFIVPYAQLGGGGVYTDISHNQSEVLLGSKENFSAEGGLGLRILLAQHCSLLLEHDYQHFSNFGTTSRNHGLNSIGGQAGLAYSF